ncbi:uncharacterized protein CcaverHIS019_0110760 [Cutaneotrichosporon cavernicola]|uniref:Zn(2)-C6 fungal-type domain-containing protein n=1 Tax=Cutaneotrichosporon cavernicola TaxID=279322 RepID=A0AA48L2A6_9TREE|nr:uncharacterized protein CcaverHIS019_0110760 [Cutaneotrichosporon cavernicola]BEI88358.1 hypothetical protein CcaverHIS019_0110760 [Cutaneotrichosporon cavernicola]BEI96131.1 hypothetical protein CcaverHIS631_0110800 [Cutaneotrichosporon cavernicola]BEJ03903.1 hypothetical protein CcaverHIS641_0110780 [Cutaneotrichosporon cavernicola]
MSESRTRSTRACVACSIRKIKCDSNDPCAHCVRFFNGECFYTTPKKRGPPKGCPPRGGHRKRQALERAEAAASEAAIHGASSGAGGNDAHCSVTGNMGVVTAQSAAARAPLNSARIPDTPKMDEMISFDPELLAMPTPRTLPSPQLVGASPSSGGSSCHAAGLSSEAIDDLLLVYETFIHPHWPMIYVPQLRSLRSLETYSPLVFDAVLAISAANSDMCENFGVNGSHKAGRSFAVACDLLTESVRARVLGTMNGRDHAPTLQSVQALLMVSLVDQGVGRTSLAYQMGGFACRMALDLGLHTHSEDMRSRDSQERCRTLWATYILDKMLAAVSQRPVNLRAVDIDAARPSIMERDEFDLWLSGGAQALLQPNVREKMETVKSHTLSSFNSWIDVMASLEIIIDQVYRPSTRRARMHGEHVDGYDEVVVHIDQQLRKWRSELPAHLQWDDDSDTAHINTGLHLLTMRGWYHISMLLLHRPQVPFLDTADSPDGYRVESGDRVPETPINFRLPNGLDASRHSATAVCKIMEQYERTFRVRKFASSWVYLVFQAATVHAGLAAHGPGPGANLLSPTRAESLRRLEQCIRWLDTIAMQWSSASRHVEILRKLSAAGARTRPPSPFPDPNYLEVTDFQSGDGETGIPGISQLDLNAWMLLWASMPTAGDDINLWQQCFPNPS